MNKLTTISSTALLSVLVAGTMSASVYAWHPAGKITKSVQNITTASDVKDANTAATAVSAKPGDILQYTIEVANVAPAADQHYNDMAKTVMTDVLPAGVELVDGSSKSIKVDLGTILPGKSVTKTYQVKVTAATDGTIENKACYSANSLNNDRPLSGCDTANVTVTVPPAPATPVATTTPETPGRGQEAPVTPVVETAAPTELPNTGINMVAPLAALVAAAVGFAVNSLRLKRQLDS